MVIISSSLPPFILHSSKDCKNRVDILALERNLYKHIRTAGRCDHHLNAASGKLGLGAQDTEEKRFIYVLISW